MVSWRLDRAGDGGDTTMTGDRGMGAEATRKTGRQRMGSTNGKAFDRASQARRGSVMRMFFEFEVKQNDTLISAQVTGMHMETHTIHGLTKVRDLV